MCERESVRESEREGQADRNGFQSPPVTNVCGLIHGLYTPTFTASSPPPPMPRIVYVSSLRIRFRDHV